MKSCSVAVGARARALALALALALVSLGSAVAWAAPPVRSYGGKVVNAGPRSAPEGLLRAVGRSYGGLKRTTTPGVLTKTRAVVVYRGGDFATAHVQEFGLLPGSEPYASLERWHPVQTAEFVKGASGAWKAKRFRVLGSEHTWDSMDNLFTHDPRPRHF